MDDPFLLTEESLYELIDCAYPFLYHFVVVKEVPQYLRPLLYST